MSNFFDRYKGSSWHRLKLLFRGIFGLILCIPMLIMTVFYILLELGNRIMDIILEDSDVEKEKDS